MFDILPQTHESLWPIPHTNFGLQLCWQLGVLRGMPRAIVHGSWRRFQRVPFDTKHKAKLEGYHSYRIIVILGAKNTRNLDLRLLVFFSDHTVAKHMLTQTWLHGNSRLLQLFFPLQQVLLPSDWIFDEMSLLHPLEPQTPRM